MGKGYLALKFSGKNKLQREMSGSHFNFNAFLLHEVHHTDSSYWTTEALLMYIDRKLAKHLNILISHMFTVLHLTLHSDINAE